MQATVLLVLGFLAQASAPVTADNAKRKAQELLTEGSALYERGDFPGALEKFSAAYATYRSPKLLYNIGQANRGIGRPVDALDALQRFLADVTDAAPEIVATAQATANELRSELGQIRVDCELAEATISLDGKDVGLAPLPKVLWAIPGQHQIVASRENSTLDIQVVDVKAGALQVVVIPAKQPAAPVVFAQHSPVKSPMERVVLARRSNKPSEDHHGWWLGRKWTWVAGGSAVLFAGGAVAAGIAMQSKFDSLNSSCGSANKDFPGCKGSDLSSLDARKNAANVLWGLAAVAGIGTGVLFYLEGRPINVVPMTGMATGLATEVRF